MPNLVRKAMAVAALSLLVAPSARAQHPQVREGFWFAIGVGGGSLGCSDCSDRTDGGAGQLAFGGTLNPSVLLAGTLNGWGRSENGANLTVGLVAATIRWYPSPSGGFYLTGGLGLGSSDLTIGNGNTTFTVSQTGFGGLAGLGYDIRVGRMLSLTPWFQWFAVKYDNGDANVGQLGLALTVH